MEQLIIPAIIAIVVAFFSVYGLTPIVIKALEKRKITVTDMNKKEKPMIPYSIDDDMGDDFWSERIGK